MSLECLVPRKFLCRYPLRTGTTLYAILFALVQIVCIIVVTLEVIVFSRCDDCTRAMLRNAYGFSGAFIIICLIMLLVHLLYLWYTTQQLKPSMVLVWVVTTTIWLGQTFCLTLVLLCLYMGDVCLVNWLLSFIFGLLAFAIAAYGALVGYGLYKEMKRCTVLQA